MAKKASANILTPFGNMAVNVGIPAGGVTSYNSVSSVKPPTNNQNQSATLDISSMVPHVATNPQQNIAPYADYAAYQNAQNQQSALSDFYNHVASQQNTQNLSSGNGSGSGSSGNGGLIGEGTGLSGDYLAQLSSYLQAYQNQQQQALAAQQQAHQQQVQNAYNNNLAALQAAYGNQANNLAQVYNNTLGQLENNYNYGAGKVNDTADNSLREAYVQKMLAQKNLAQQLNASGLTGGAAESTIAGLLNNYGNARNNIETQRLNDLTSLLNEYQNNANSAGRQYADALNELEANNFAYNRQLQNDLANGIIGTYDDLYSALNSGYNTYANAMQGLAANLVGNEADLAADNYSRYLNALYKASTGSGTGSSAANTALGVTGNGISSNSLNNRVNAIKQRWASDRQGLLDELMKQYGSYEDAISYLRSIGVVA